MQRPGSGSKNMAIQETKQCSTALTEECWGVRGMSRNEASAVRRGQVLEAFLAKEGRIYPEGKEEPLKCF